jgi:cytochrome c556
MIRHQWAADRLWDGLVGPSDVSWQAGAEVLRDAPLFTDAVTEDVEQYEAVTKLAWQVHEIGALAATVPDHGRRAELYGTLLGTCASCHDLILYPK